MRKFIIHKKQLLVSLLVAATLVGCSLDYENTGAINPDNVWKDKVMINAFLTDIYGGMMPGWPLDASHNSDEGLYSGGNNMSEYLRGVISEEKNGQGLGYENIEKINFFLDKLSSMSESIVPADEQVTMRGQAHFWRAWDYWGKIRNLGGVPLILKPQNASNRPSLFVPRNSTTECYNQILQDLDDAIAELPDAWGDKDYGRIDKGAAMAFKGRVQLWYASPLFNPSNDQSRWEAAYKTNLEAVNYLRGQGKGLFEDYKELWYKEQNKEVIMVNQFYYPDHAYNDNRPRPEAISKDAADNDQPYFPLIMAYPKRDGSVLELDVNRLENDPAYNKQFMAEFYDRDDRFEGTVFYGGGNYPTPEEQFAGGAHFWNVWMKSLDDPNVLVSMASHTQFMKQLKTPATGYYQIKAVDRKNDMKKTNEAAKDWIEIRFAEVLMNMGECANEVGKSTDALQVLYDIRKRAGIVSTDGKYGVTATSKEDIREAYIKERQVEFAFEGRRFGDLRRLKRFDIMNSHVHRATIAPMLLDNTLAKGFDWKLDIKDPEVQKMFKMVYVPNVDKNPEQKFNLSENHWFYPLSRGNIESNPKLLQNNEWGGTFDPLK